MDKADGARAWRDGPSGGEIAGAVVLFVFQIVTAIPFFILTIFTSMASDGCSERKCNFVAATGAIFMAPAAAFCALAVTIPLTIRSGKRGGSVIVPPLLGVMSVIAVGILGLVLNYLALN
jgi:hypothetical protein